MSFDYEAAWLKSHGAIALSEDLPLMAGTFMPPAQGDAPGAIDDARPDRWGERVIKRFDKPPRLGTLEFLYL